MKCQVLYEKNQVEREGGKKKEEERYDFKSRFFFFITFCPAGTQLKKKK